MLFGETHYFEWNEISRPSYTHKTKGAFEGAEGAIWLMAPSAPSKAPLVLCVWRHGTFRGAILAPTGAKLVAYA